MKRRNEDCKVDLGKQKHHFSKKKFNKQLISVTSTVLLLFSNYGLFPLQVLAEEQVLLDTEEIEPQLGTLTDELPVQPAITSEAPVRSITYYWNDGTDQSEISEETTQAKPAEDMIREGYTFQAWNTQADGQGDSYLPDEALSEDVTELYAVWEEEEVVDSSEPEEVISTEQAPATESTTDSTEEPAVAAKAVPRAQLSDGLTDEASGLFVTEAIQDEDDRVRITGYNGDAEQIKNLTIPSEIDGKAVEIDLKGVFVDRLSEVEHFAIQPTTIVNKPVRLTGTFNQLFTKNYLPGVAGSNQILQTVDFGDADSSVIKDMSSMFYRCEKVESINIKGLNTEEVQNMSRMFSDCKNLASLNLSNFETGNVLDMGNMLSGCAKISGIVGLSNFDTQNVRNMTGMFTSCQSIEKLELSNFSTGNVENMASMFSDCSNLSEIKGLEKFDTRTVSNMQEMFKNCKRITSLDLSNFDSQSITNMMRVFNGCSELTTLKLSSKFKLDARDTGLRNPPSSSAEGSAYYWVKDKKDATALVEENAYDSAWDLINAHNKLTDDDPHTYTIEKAHEVTFDVAGGSVSIPTQKIFDDQKATIPAYQGTKRYYHLEGWKNGDGIFDFDTSINTRYGLTANWVINQYKVVFDENGGAGSMSEQEMTCETGETKVPLAENQFTRQGYVFSHWTTQPDGTGQRYEDQENVKNLSETHDDTVDLYAQWKLDSGLVKQAVEKVAPTKVYNGSKEHTFEVDLTTITGEKGPLKLEVSGEFAESDVKAQQFTVKSWVVNQEAAGIDDLASEFTINGEITPLAITQDQLTIDEASKTKVYDGSEASNLTATIKAGVLIDENAATLKITDAKYDDKNAEAGKPISYGWKLEGAQGTNYSLPKPENVTGEITKLAVTVDWTATDKVYNGTEAAVVTGEVKGKVPDDKLTVSGTGAFEDKKVGAGKKVKISDIQLAGDDKDNYTPPLTGEAKAAISIYEIQENQIAFTNQNKPFDNTTDASQLTAKLTNGIPFASDVLDLELTNAKYTDQNIGPDIDITYDLKLTGADAENYKLTTKPSVTGSITNAELTREALVERIGKQEPTKVYNGNSDYKFTINITDLAKPKTRTGTKIVLEVTGKFDQKTVDAKAFTVTGWKVTSNNAEVPAFDKSFDIKGSITPKTIKADWDKPEKPYDGTKAVEVIGTPNELERGDTVAITAEANFTDANAGEDKPVDITNVNLVGDHAANYSIAKIGSTKGTITKYVLQEDQIEFSELKKEYNQKFDSLLKAKVKDKVLFGSDQVVIEISEAKFASNQAGTGNAISYEWKLTGAQSTNYRLPDKKAVVKGEITKKPITAEWDEPTKIYDGQKAAEVKSTLKEVIPGDVVGITFEANFEDANAAEDKDIEIAGIALNGKDGGNYSIGARAKTTGTIKQYALTHDQIEFSKLTKEYDKTKASLLEATVNEDELFGEDDVTIEFTKAEYADDQVGTGKTINFEWTLTGKQGVNYRLPDKKSVETGEITKRALSVKWSNPTKIYDGEKTADVTGTLEKVVDGDAVGITFDASFKDADAGEGKAVAITGITLTGDDAKNYSIDESGSTTGTITKKGLKGTWSADDKVYDGTTKATVTGALEGMIPGEETAVSISGTGEFTDKNVAGSIPVTITASRLAGDGAKNYDVSENVDATAAISLYQIEASQITFGNLNKPFDTTDTAAQITAKLPDGAPFATDDLSVALTDAVYGQTDIGKDIAITYNWDLAGEDAKNYKLPEEQKVLRGDITEAVMTEKAVIDQIKKADAPTKVYNGKADHTYTVDITDAAKKKTRAATKIELEVTGEFAAPTAGEHTFTVTGWEVKSGNAEVPKFGDSFTIEGEITQKRIGVDWDHPEKTYDGKDEVEISGTPKDLVEGDEVIVTTTAFFEDVNAGTGKQMIIPEAVATGKDAANYLVLPSNGDEITGTIKAYELQPDQIEFTGLSKEYDGEVDSLLKAAIKENVLFGEDKVGVAISAAKYADENAGTGIAISYKWKLTGEQSGNYRLSAEEDVEGAITPKALTAEWTAEGKDYDGTVDAKVTGKLSGLIGEDQVTVKGTGAFEDKHAGPNKQVNVTAIQLEGNEAGNYTVDETSETKAAILAYQIKEGQISFGNLNKPFDTTDSAAQITAALPEEAPFAADDVEVTLTDAVYGQKDIGKDIAITYNWDLAGEDAKNYLLPEDMIALQGEITEAVMTQDAVIERIKRERPVMEYDGRPEHSFTIDITDLAQRKTRAATQILLEVTGGFVQASAGEQAFTVTKWEVTSGNAELPDLSEPFQMPGEIQPRAITVNWSAADKEYDGSKVAKLIAACDDILGEDEVTFAANGTYDDKNCGNHEVRLDAASVQLSGAHAGNYIVETQNDTCNIEITPRPATVEWQVADKVYDGKTDAKVTGTLTNLVDKDEVKVATTAAFSDKNAEENKAVRVAAPTISGADHQNYLITAPTEATATISPYDIQLGQISFAQTVKAFDTSADAKLTARLIGLPLELDDLRIDITDARYPDSEIGENKEISYNWNLAGADQGNYRLPAKPAVTGAIAAPTVGDDTQARIIELLKQQTPEKEYDGTSTHQFELDITSAFGEPTDRAATPTQIMLNVTGTFEQFDAGERSFNVTDWNIVSNNAVIGELPVGIVLEGSITKRAATIHWTAADKVYDGTTTAAVQATVDGLVANDQVTVKGVGAFVDKNVGAHKAVTITSSEVTGDATVNYEFATPDIGITANIQQKALTIRGVQTVNRRANDSRLVDLVGTNAALEGVLPADQKAVSFDLGQGTMADAAAGNGKAVTTNIQLTGDEAGNYVLTQPTDLTVDIIKKKVTVTIVDENGNKQEVELDEGAKLPRPKDPVKDGFTFEGWYADEALTQPFDFDQRITGNVTLYPKWSRNIPVATTTNRNIVTPRVVTSSGNTTTSATGKSFPSTGDTTSSLRSMLGLGAIATAIAAWKKRKG